MRIVSRSIIGASLTLCAALALQACTTATTNSTASGSSTATSEAVSPTNETALAFENDVREGYLRHAAMTQLHRWWQYYEDKESGLENQLDILADDVEVISVGGTAKGHDQYSAALKMFPPSWQNAHDLKTSEVVVNPDGTMTMKATIDFHNIGMDKNGGITKSLINYTNTLQPTDELLPEFSVVNISRVSTGAGTSFKSEYAANRLKSVLHYFLAIVEDPKRNPEPFKEILADDFSIAFSQEPITSYEGMAAWLAGPGSQVVASTHRITDFAYKNIGEDMYELTAIWDWDGILPNGSYLQATTRHIWTLEDDKSERFARIKSVKVETLKPFRPKVL